MAEIYQICLFISPGLEEKFDSSIITAIGYEVTTLQDSEAVVTWIKTCPDDVLLIVIHPSATIGLDLSASFLHIQPDLPILLVTQDSNASYLKRALEIGLADYLTLPVDASGLKQSMQRCLSRQKSLQASNRYAHVFLELKEGIILTDYNGRLLGLNPSARDIFTITIDEPEGMLVREVFHHPDLLDMFSIPDSYPHRSEISLDDGRVFSAQASVIPQIGVAVILQEITHLKELDRIKTDFVNTVSHDLRSPLTAIYGYAGLIDRVGPINELQTDFVRRIQSSVQNITSLINDLLELGRVEADYDIQMEEISIKDIINRCIDSLDYQVNGKMQVIDVSFPEAIPKILGNPLHLQRMITNLVENAIKFTPPLGKISLRCRSEGSQLFLEVEDNGPGIPLDDQPFVFDKFFRSNNISADVPGTGLGLSIVKSIVDKHHGRIWLESSPDGTTFTVILPVK